MVCSVDSDRLLELIEEGAQVVDVSPDAEYAAQRIPGAISIGSG